ncbi:hypothetical protein [Jiangella asiatica]|uniref:Sigma-70 family RNA polymerase sigma factor n=1 Tax=Jiangella asiatica TaxID=2530372 RepID=A0A4R5CIK4_9ACTN|nr:hypothetical protein [Jiangella asiatica]TDD98939.1 hypothetical protein E1269_28060 [Jiangella asiatica]
MSVITEDPRTRTGARCRTGTGVAGRLNDEWARLRTDDATAATVAGWAVRHPALAGCGCLDDVELAVAGADRRGADDLLLALLRLAQSGDGLAGRTVLQLMLGKAIRIATSHAGRDSRDNLEHAAVAALWATIATYPVARRPAKVAANLAMDTLGAVSRELAHSRAETPAEPGSVADALGEAAARDDDGDLELVELLAWAVEAGTISAADATLVLDIYAPAPGQEGGRAAAERRGISWPAARQRASRAVRKLARSVRSDSFAA